mmetsp:Transcript_54948/g.176210  ORF Transcript_54948/g.176210 Transcript_54948/m.176210 type:complete len:396 (+) Transcript_54948:219-1406(+)
MVNSSWLSNWVHWNGPFSGALHVSRMGLPPQHLPQRCWPSGAPSWTSWAAREAPSSCWPCVASLCCVSKAPWITALADRFCRMAARRCSASAARRCSASAATKHHAARPAARRRTLGRTPAAAAAEHPWAVEAWWASRRAMLMQMRISLGPGLTLLSAVLVIAAWAQTSWEEQRPMSWARTASPMVGLHMAGLSTAAPPGSPRQNSVSPWMRCPKAAMACARVPQNMTGQKRMLFPRSPAPDVSSTGLLATSRDPVATADVREAAVSASTARAQHTPSLDTVEEEAMLPPMMHVSWPTTPEAIHQAASMQAVVVPAPLLARFALTRSARRTSRLRWMREPALLPSPRKERTQKQRRRRTRPRAGDGRFPEPSSRRNCSASGRKFCQALGSALCTT